MWAVAHHGSALKDAGSEIPVSNCDAVSCQPDTAKCSQQPHVQNPQMALCLHILHMLNLYPEMSNTVSSLCASILLRAWAMMEFANLDLEVGQSDEHGGMRWWH